MKIFRVIWPPHASITSVLAQQEGDKLTKGSAEFFLSHFVIKTVTA